MMAARERDRFRKHESGYEKRKKNKKKQEFHKSLLGSLDKFVIGNAVSEPEETPTASRPKNANVVEEASITQRIDTSAASCGLHQDGEVDSGNQNDAEGKGLGSCHFGVC